jgi:RHS repeat-associated protein
VSDGPTSFAWNPRNQLSGLFGAEQASYQYDADGRRASRTINGNSVAYLYDELDAVQELNGGIVIGNILRGNELDEFFERWDSAGLSSPLADSLGSIVAETDNASLIKRMFSYEPYGRTSVIGSGQPSAAQFTGREPDTAGIYYYRARYYSPQFHRFISEDPMDPGSYAYADGNPVTLTDPLGLFSIDPSCECPDLSEQLRRAETLATQGAPRILQKSMRECIQRRLKEGKVKCGGEKCEKGSKPDKEGRVLYGHSNPFSKTVTVCAPAFSSDAELARTIIHEFAHTCKAREGRARRVENEAIPR